MFHHGTVLRATAWLMLVAPAAGAGEPNAAGRDKQALASVQSYVGSWRGVGQPKRGSNVGAWTEESTWAWSFAGGRPTIVGELKGDKYYSRLELQADEQPGQFVLLATGIDNKTSGEHLSPQRFLGRKQDGGLIFTAEQIQNDRPARISLRLVAGGDRMLTLFEKKAGDDAFARLAEVGATRKGSSFAKSAAVGHECIVTGGLGTIAVEHKGKKYYVCCGGCREYFLADPETALAEFRQRKSAEANVKPQ